VVEKDFGAGKRGMEKEERNTIVWALSSRTDGEDEDRNSRAIRNRVRLTKRGPLQRSVIKRVDLRSAGHSGGTETADRGRNIKTDNAGFLKGSGPTGEAASVRGQDHAASRNPLWQPRFVQRDA